ncbi:MAG: DUF1049 domain-containing protein [Chloroflexota bacterium]|nr:MAG: DUF1049 domain-containing protein [Chloroflexota bacterium]
MLVAALLFAVGIAVFAVQNTTAVPVQFLGWRTDAVAASVLVLLSAALGAVVTLLLGAAREVRLRLRLRAMDHELSISRERLRALAVPIVVKDTSGVRDGRDVSAT